MNSGVGSEEKPKGQELVLLPSQYDATCKCYSPTVLQMLGPQTKKNGIQSIQVPK